MIDVETKLVAIGIVERCQNPQRRLLIKRRIEYVMPTDLGPDAVEKHVAVYVDRLLCKVDVEICIEDFV